MEALRKEKDVPQVSAGVYILASQENYSPLSKFFPVFWDFYYWFLQILPVFKVLLQILPCFSIWTKILSPLGKGGGMARIYIPGQGRAENFVLAPSLDPRHIPSPWQDFYFIFSL